MKKLSIILSILFIIAVCIGLAACGNDADDSKTTTTTQAAGDPTAAPTQPPIVGAKVGDTFEFSGRTITLSEITEDLGRAFGSAGDPDGKWVVMIFSIADGETAFSVTPDGLSVNGKAAADAAGLFSGGSIARAGSSLRTTSTMSFAVLFDVDQNTSLDQLALTVEG